MRGGLRVGGVVLFTGLVLAYGAFAWDEAGDQGLAAAEAEGRALLGAVAAGVESSVEASRAVEGLLAEGLIAAARDVGRAVAGAAGLEEEALRREAQARGLVGAAILDPELGIVASFDASESESSPSPQGPFGAARLARLDVDSAVRRLRASGLGASDTAVIGFDESPFAARVEFCVAARVPEIPGFVLLRGDASRLEQFRRDVGIARVLRHAAAAPGIASLAVQSVDGTCLAADDPGLAGAVLPAPPVAPVWREDASGARTLDLAVVASWTHGPPGHLRVALDAAPVDEVIRRSRTGVAVMTAAALAAGLGGFVALAVVERRRREAETDLLAELARRERFAAMGRLSAGVAHEIRGPLNAVGLSTQLLAREAEGPARRERLAELTAAIRAGVARADAAVSGFLDLGRPRGPLVAVPLDVADVVRAVLAAEGGVLDVRPPAEPVHVLGDRDDLTHALGNLVRNARQAAPPESVRATWRADGALCVIDIDDGGPGVAPADRAAIFEPFVTRRAGGTGLGLAIARDEVVRHGGTIEVLDAPGGGARFRVRLPVAVESVAALEARVSSPSRIADDGGASGPAPRGRA